MMLRLRVLEGVLLWKLEEQEGILLMWYKLWMRSYAEMLCDARSDNGDREIWTAHLEWTVS
jgi:hypothetical protein